MTGTATQTVTPAKYHSGMGWPHFNTRTGACLCMQPCCWGASGCRCKTGCSGVGHSGCYNATVDNPAAVEPVSVSLPELAAVAG